MEAADLTDRRGRRKRLVWVAVPVVILLTVAVAVLWSARRALDHATRSAASAGQVVFTMHVLEASSDVARGLGAEMVAPGPRYSTAAVFDGDLYLGGQSGLTVLRADGSAARSLRPGFELPLGAINSMASGRLRGAGEPQLLLATGGAGLLLVEAGHGAKLTIRQMLPVDTEARDLTAVAALASGDVLLGTRHQGVLLYNGATLVPVRFAAPGVNAARLQVTALTAVDSTSFLIGTRDAGVFYVHGGTVDHADAGSGLPDDQVECIGVAAGHAFVGTPVGTAEFDLGAASFRPVRTLAQGVFSHAVAVDERQLTIGTLDQGIVQVPLGPSLRRASIAAGRANESGERVEALVATPEGLFAVADGGLLRKGAAGWAAVLWPAGSGSGVSARAGPNNASLADRNISAPADRNISADPNISGDSNLSTLADPNISALAFAPDGTLYVGFFDRGIDLLGPGGGIRHLEDDHLFCINRLVLDPRRQTIAAGTANGLVLFDAQGKPRQTLTRRDGLIADHVTDVIFTASGTVVATPAGITFLKPSGAESLYAFEGLVNNHVYALGVSEASGGLLAGTLGGMSILKAERVERNFTVANSTLKHNWITALLPMPDDTVLVGTYGAGLEMLDKWGRFTPVELPAGTRRDLVINANALYATSSHIYAGTLGEGMLVYSVASGRWSAVTGGLPSLNVTAFAARGGEIYVGTENGLVRMPERNLR